MAAKKSIHLLLVALSLGLSAPLAAGQDGCRQLFDGETLSGWSVLGEARFFAEEEAIVGETVLGIGNSFLRTDAEYADFDLTLEFRVEGDVNSGVQFRSGVYREPTKTRYQSGRGPRPEITWPAGTVFGYQAEIDPSERAWSAEIHEEAGRGWLQTLAREPVRAPLERDAWNQMRIRARGESVETWLNGRPVAQLVDGLRSSGFIALQVHSIFNPRDAGKRVRWRRLQLCPVAAETTSSEKER